MAFNFDQISTSSNSPVDNDHNDTFYAVVDRLKAQKALPRDSFPKEMPFFNISSISKESQVKELFQDVSDPNLYKSLLKNIISLPEEKSPELITQRLSAMQVMGFAQIILYKVLPCCDENCANRPREVATHNQYKDYEYECPFYHHDKDHRRMVLTPSIDDEFTYKANYFEDGKHDPMDKQRCSQNYFESMFHPLYYKMFRCKREYCNFSQCCPFYHSEEEKKTWDKVFSNFIRKDRISYVKDKQKYYERNANSNQAKFQRSNNGEQSNQILRSNPTTPKPNNFRRPNRKVNTVIKSGQENSPNGLNMNDWKPHSAQKQNSKKNFAPRKNSGDLPNGKVSPVNFNQYPEQKEALFKRAC